MTQFLVLYIKYVRTMKHYNIAGKYYVNNILWQMVKFKITQTVFQIVQYDYNIKWCIIYHRI